MSRDEVVRAVGLPRMPLTERDCGGPIVECWEYDSRGQLGGLAFTVLFDATGLDKASVNEAKFIDATTSLYSVSKDGISEAPAFAAGLGRTGA